MNAERLAAAGLRVKPLEWETTYYVVHAAGSFSFFIDEGDAENYGDWLGRGYYVYDPNDLKSYGDRLRAAKEAWETETKKAHEARILAALEEVK